MKIIVSGSESQIAKSLQKVYISNKYYQFHFFDKKSFDISNYDLIKNKFDNINPDILLNCAAYTNVIQAEKNNYICNNINNISLLNLSELCNQYKTTFIHFSTDYVFDGKKKIKYNESDNTNPLSFYGKTKLEGEKKIINTSDNYLILRVSWLFSEYKKNFFNFVIDKLFKNEDVYAVNDLFSIPTSSQEISKFIFFLLKNKNNINLKKLKNLYHFVNSGPIVSWYEFALNIKNNLNTIVNSKSKIIPISANEFFKQNIRPKYSAMNNTKLTKKFNFQIENWQLSINSLIANNIKK